MRKSLTALDMLFMPADDQTIVSCLTRKPRQTIDTLAANTKVPLSQLKRDLQRLLKNGDIQAEQKNGQLTYFVKLALTRSELRNTQLSALDIFSSKRGAA